MRFHVGFSFRLKNLKKFLIPFLLGIGAYFGLSSFNLLQVKAYGNLESYFNIEVSEQDFSEVDFFGVPMQDLLDLGRQENDYFFVNTKLVKVYQGWVITYALYPKNGTNPSVGIYNNKGSSSGSSNVVQSYDYSYQSFYEYDLGTNSTEQSFNTDYNNLYECLTTNVCNGYYSNSQYTIGTYYLDSNINNYDSYDIDVFGLDGSYYYNNQLSVVNWQMNISDNWYYIKTIKVNGTIVDFYDYFPTYCDLYNCESGGGGAVVNLANANKIDDFFVSNIDINDLSNTELHWSFNYFSIDFARSLQWDAIFFGRVDHGTYYSYEEVNCDWRLTSAFGGDDRLYDTVVDHFSCSSTLSSYDNLYVRFRLSYYSSDYPNLIDNLSLNTNNGYINISPYYNGSNRYYIMDYFSNLPSDFNMLVSTQKEMSNVTFKSTNNNILMASVSRDTNIISNFANSQQLTFGTFNNTNAMIYNYTPSFNDTSNVFVFIDKSDIISFVQNGTFTYYDNNNSLSSGAINNTYQVIVDEYDLNYYFNQVNEFINSIDTDLQEVHNIFENVFSIMPVFLQLFFVVLYILLLSYLLFKFIRS